MKLVTTYTASKKQDTLTLHTVTSHVGAMNIVQLEMNPITELEGGARPGFVEMQEVERQAHR